ncbi:MAG: diadenylate cyclase CdaA [Lachnospiraceae bacterium]|nr:diadenylate cyclase CdaA [Lachnospiraceae bacterium]
MREMTASLYAVIDKYFYWIDLPKITVIDVIEIIIIAFVIYEVLAWIKNTRAWALLRGIIVILLFIVIAAIFRMNVILWLAANLVSIAVIALIIIFQPELRNALETLGRGNLFSRIFQFNADRNASERMSEKTINDIVKACQEMGKDKTGALIVVERDIMLREYIRTGIELDSLISSQLLINIFEHNTPLHDGAIIVRGNRVVAATCYLPLSDNMELSKELGTRHRAAVGISEVSDSLTIVVSEETGALSIAMDRELYQDVSADFLREKLKEAARIGNENRPFRQRMRNRAMNTDAEGARKDSSSEDKGRGSGDA